jgi:hypothetical protein
MEEGGGLVPCATGRTIACPIQELINVAPSITIFFC